MRDYIRELKIRFAGKATTYYFRKGNIELARKWMNRSLELCRNRSERQVQKLKRASYERLLAEGVRLEDYADK